MYTATTTFQAATNTIAFIVTNLTIPYNIYTNAYTTTYANAPATATISPPSVGTKDPPTTSQNHQDELGQITPTTCWTNVLYGIAGGFVAVVTWLDHIANEGPPTKPDASYRHLQLLLQTLTGATVVLDVLPNDSIKMLKRKISEIVGIKDPKLFWFTIDGRPIKGDTAEKANVGHFNITTESTIRIQLYIIGGDKNRVRHYVVYASGEDPRPTLCRSSR